MVGIPPDIPVFSGESTHSLDTKNRVAIPARWRFPGDDSEQSLLVPHPTEKYLIALPPPQVQALREQRQAARFGDKRRQVFWDRLFASAHAFGVDAQRRVALPEKLRQTAGIEREAVLVGSGSVYKIFSPEAWTRQCAEVTDEELAAGMEEAGF